MQQYRRTLELSIDKFFLSTRKRSPVDNCLFGFFPVKVQLQTKKPSLVVAAKLEAVKVFLRELNLKAWLELSFLWLNFIFKIGRKWLNRVT